LSWALAAVAIAVRAKADAPRTPSLSRLFDIWQSSLVSAVNMRAPAA
jgi:hypothetical protein